MIPVLAADSIGRSFGSVRVLKSAGLRAWPGRITALLGRNGSGKTTLLRIAAGRLRPHWGVVRFGDEASLRPRLHRMARRGLCYVPQEGLLPRDRTPREVARLVVRIFPEAAAGDGGSGAHGRGGGAADERIAAWAERWELTDLLDSPGEELSGGERNRASAGLAVLRRPRCLLIDEPLTGSAPRDRERVVAGLRELKDGGCAVVVTGHEATDLLAMADRVVWMVAGTTRDLGSAREALASHQFCREYLGPGFRPEAAAPLPVGKGEARGHAAAPTDPDGDAP